MTTPWPLAKLLYNISETNYDSTFSTYRFWYGLGATHGGMSNHQLYNDLLSNPRADLTTLSFEWIPMDKQSRRRGEKPQFTGKGQLIHNDAHLLLRFITDAEKDPILSTHAIGLHDRLCRESLEQFFRKTLDDVPGGWAAEQWLSEFYTRVNLIAHWVNLGYAKLEDVRDYILQSLALQPTVYDHQLNSLMILLRISGATFAAYVDPSIMDRCCALLTPSNLKNRLVLTGLAQVRALISVIKRDYESGTIGDSIPSEKWLGGSSSPSGPPQRKTRSGNPKAPRSCVNSGCNTSGTPKRGGIGSNHLPYPRPIQIFLRREFKVFSSPISVDQHHHLLRRYHLG